MDIPYYWLIAALLFFVLELLTPGFVVACFGVGALLGMVAAFIGLGFVWQVLGFVLGSILALFLLKPLLERVSYRPPLATGVEALYGREGRVSVAFKGSRGRIMIDDVEWPAELQDPSQSVSEDERVRIVRHEGNLLIVEPTNPTSV